MTIKDGDTAYASEVITGYGKLAAQNAYQTLQANDVFVNRDNLGADEFLSAAGTNSTVDTGTSTALFVTNNYQLGYTDLAGAGATHDPDSFTNPTFAFDSDDGTAAVKQLLSSAATTNWEFGKTFGSTYVAFVDLKVNLNFTGSSSGTLYVKLQTYDGAAWNDEATLLTGSGTYAGRYTLDGTVQGIRISSEITLIGANDRTLSIYTIAYGEYNTPLTVETNEIIDCDSAPSSVVVYAQKTLPAGTSIIVDVSDDGGDTFAVTGGALNTAIDTTTLTGSSIALKFNLATTDTSATPKIYGYGLAITDK